MKKIKMGVTGIGGRMGKSIAQSILSSPNYDLVFASESPDSKLVGEKISTLLDTSANLQISTSIGLNDNIHKPDVLIDFTTYSATMDYVNLCVKNNIKLVIGTTGHEKNMLRKISNASSKIPIVLAPNMSIGINLLFHLVGIVSFTFDDSYDREVIEYHHRDKIDAPSGTALKIGEIISKAKKNNKKEKFVFSRKGNSVKRKSGEIGFSTIRGGDIIGDHTALFAGDGERLEITHRSSKRTTYVAGAIKAALFLMKKRKGLFNMHDVLNLKQLKISKN